MRNGIIFWYLPNILISSISKNSYNDDNNCPVFPNSLVDVTFTWVGSGRYFNTIIISPIGSTDFYNTDGELMSAISTNSWLRVPRYLIGKQYIYFPFVGKFNLQ